MQKVISLKSIKYLSKEISISNREKYIFNLKYLGTNYMDPFENLPIRQTSNNNILLKHIA